MHDTRHTAPKASAAGSIAQPWQVLHQGNFKVMESLTLYHGLLRLEVWKEQGQFWFLIKGTVKASPFLVFGIRHSFVMKFISSQRIAKTLAFLAPV